MLIVACESQELSDLSYAARSCPGLYFVDFGLFHLYYAFCHSNAQEIEVILLEGALFWVEMEVVLAEPVKDLPDQEAVVGNVFVLCFSLLSPRVDCYIVHVDRDAPLVDGVSEYGVYHSLEGGR